MEEIKAHDYKVKVVMRGQIVQTYTVSANNANEARRMVRELVGKIDFIVLPV